MFRIKLNEGGMSGFDKNVPNRNYWEDEIEAMRWISIHLQKKLTWGAKNGVLQTNEIAYNGEPVAEVYYDVNAVLEKRKIPLRKI